MKLRLRPFESKETLKIEVPNSCTLPQLRRILSETLPNSPSPDSIRLSLNRKDDLQPDGDCGLQFLGIAAGDLIFFSVELLSTAVMTSNSQYVLSPVTDSAPRPGSNNSQCSTKSNAQNTLPEIQITDSMTLDPENGKALDMEETVNDMEVDDAEDNANSYNNDELLGKVIDKSFSVPGFLRKVFTAELGDGIGRDHKLIVITIHAVMLESGFVGFDEKVNTVVNGFQFRDEWPLGLHKLSLFYTLPESLGGARGEVIKWVALRFQNTQHFINVYGMLGNGSGKGDTHRVRLNEDHLVPFLNVVWANCGVKEYVSGKDEALSPSPEKEVFKFWRTVKDNLALPMLIDLREEAGLGLPPCFMRLPTELKLKVLESLPGVDVAKISCVCSELRYLASSDDLWNLKLSVEFPYERKKEQVSWKKAFSMAWSRWNGRKLASRVRPAPSWPAPSWSQPRRRRYPSPFMVQRAPRIIGGDYDIMQQPSGDDLLTRLHDSVPHPLRNYSPQCNLGARGGRFQ